MWADKIEGTSQSGLAETPKQEATLNEEFVRAVTDVLDESKGSASFIHKLRESAKIVKHKEKLDLEVPFEYDSHPATISYNPNLFDFKDSEIGNLLIHELAHHLSLEEYDPFNSVRFVQAILESGADIAGNIDKIRKLVDAGGTIYDNMFVQDILDALSLSRIKTTYGHGYTYWKRVTVIGEIFANISVLHILGLNIQGEDCLAKLVRAWEEVIDETNATGIR